MFDRLIASDPPPEHRWSAGAKLVFANLVLNGVLLMLAPGDVHDAGVRADPTVVILTTNCTGFPFAVPSWPEPDLAPFVVPTARGIAVEHVDRDRAAPIASLVNEARLAVPVWRDSMYRLSMDVVGVASAGLVRLTVEAVLDSSWHAERRPR